ncbi:hypothetical protein SBADM41S_11105 [Streptomyces badius]
MAWDLEREDWRTFRADRITPTPPHGPRFVPRPPPAEDLAAYVSRGVAVSAYAARAVILLKAPLAEAAQRISPSAGVLETVDADTCRLTTGAPDLTVLVIHVLLMGIDFEVIEPPELTELMRDAWAGSRGRSTDREPWGRVGETYGKERTAYGGGKFRCPCHSDGLPLRS